MYLTFENELMGSYSFTYYMQNNNGVNLAKVGVCN